MIASPENTLEDSAPPEHYLVSHGKSGGLGSFITRVPCALRRGDRVVIDSPRGREIGTVLCPANVRQSRILGAVASGTILRPFDGADEVALQQLDALAWRLFESQPPSGGADPGLARGNSRRRRASWKSRAILQFVGPGETPLDAFVQTLRFKTSNWMFAWKTWLWQRKPKNLTVAANRIAAKPKAAAAQRAARAAAAPPAAPREPPICAPISLTSALRWKTRNAPPCFNAGLNID